LLNPLRLLHFLDAVTGSLTTDKTFGAKQIRTLALKLRSTSPAHVELLTVPLRTGSFNTSVGNVVEWDPVFAPQLFTDITDDRPIGAADQGKSAKVTIPPSSIALDVRNATDTNGLAARVAANLSTLGFHISSTGNARPGSDPHAVTVRYGPGRADSAKTVAAAIPGSRLQPDPTFGNNLQVVVGSTYHGVQRVVVASPSTDRTIKVRNAAQDICS
jgi:archaellum component FlaG (FlaF/FlaG flagellin family)